MIDSYICIDLETTGLDLKTDKIIEIGAVKVENGITVEEWGTFVNPGRPLDERVAELTGIQDSQLASAPFIDDVLPKFLALMGSDILLGHSVTFDYSFIKKVAVDRRISFEREGIDTLKIARKYLTELESRSLEYLCGYYDIPHNAHRALYDARATVQLYQKLAEQFYNKEEWESGTGLFWPKKLQCHIKRETPVTIPQKEQLYKLVDKHKLIIDYDIEKLTRSEASRQIARLLAEYGR